MNILLIEDHDFQRQALMAQLSRLIDPNKDTIHCAANGLDALTMMQTFQPELLFCDLKMPEMDGITFLGHIAEQDFQGGIIITSALTKEVLLSVAKMCKNYGLNLLGSLAKPTPLDQLNILLQQAREIKSPLSQGTSEILTDEEIEQGLINGWLTPYFQPIVDLNNGQWIACEALIRFIHPERGIIPAYQFIKRLVQLGKDSQLALLIINFVISHQAYFHHRKIAVNISAKTLVDRNFINSVLALKEQYPTLHQLIYFELTEAEIFESAGQALESASRLEMHDFTLSIDDFGTGYSSLKQLGTLPFHSLKLDISFVQAMSINPTAEAIVEACLLLTQRLGLTSIAEGIEDISLWKSLQKMQCEQAQGYFISPPLPYNRIDPWHQEWQQRYQQLQS